MKEHLWYTVIEMCYGDEKSKITSLWVLLLFQDDQGKIITQQVDYKDGSNWDDEGRKP